MWSVYYDPRLEDWLETIPADVKAKILRIVDMLVEYGPTNVREPYVKHLEGPRNYMKSEQKVKTGLEGLYDG